jgi:HK97 family phage major capsid protein
MKFQVPPPPKNSSEHLRAASHAIVAAAAKESRRMTPAELDELERIEFERSQAEATEQARSRWMMPVDEYLRSITKGGADVGNASLSGDVLKKFNALSPLIRAHSNIVKRGNGQAYYFMREVAGGAAEVRAEGTAGSTDNATAFDIVMIPFKTYSGQQVNVSQEILDDSAIDIAGEVLGVGLAKASVELAADVIELMKSLFLDSDTFTPTETAGTSWSVDDLLDMHASIPTRHRDGLKWFCSGATAKVLKKAIFTEANAPLNAAIGFGPDSLVEDDGLPADVLFCGNLTNAIAIGHVYPPRMQAIPTSAGATFEALPRFAADVRDGTALAVRKLKAA